MNRLAAEQSPYLLQHKSNPVDWWPWGEAAFSAAKDSGKPVFLSIGYSTCHWCHVMAQESFENPEIARLMNEGFINIKLDREERPDVDRLYMAFVQATTGGGGWPMSVWLTPEGRPFYGGTYFPPADSYGRAGFANILRQISRLWREDRERVEAESKRILDALSAVGRGGPTGEFEAGEAPLELGFETLSRTFDEEHGGFGGAPKFPRPSAINFLLRFATRAGEEKARRSRGLALFTLRKMAAGGMRDHLGGGFHRYSVDEFWHVPHFEKMLYDQAQLAISFTEAWQLTGEESFAAIARETLDYVLRDMAHPKGGFFSAEDADSLLSPDRPEHAEGAFYVWEKREIARVLGPDEAGIFCLHYGVEEDGNARAASDPRGEFRGRNILFERQDAGKTAEILGLSRETVLVSLRASRKKLLKTRAQRPRPHLDDKILTAWNGLMISALARSGAALRERGYVEAAAGTAGFLREYLTMDGALLRAWREQAGKIFAFAEDYAFLVQGLLDLYEASWNSNWLSWAIELQERQDRLFQDERSGSYFSSAAGDPLIPLRMKEDYDGAEPSVNSVGAINLLRLARILHDHRLEARARRVIAASQQTLDRMPVAVPQMLVALDLALSPPAQAVVAGSREAEDVREWNARLHREFRPRRALLLAEENGFLADKVPLLSSMRPIDGRAALYLCEDFVCQRPQVLP